MDNLSEMAVFAKVVQQRGFTAAAQALGLSKPAVSKQIGRLEDRLGARLLNRTTRKLSLTEVGAVFYERCARIVEEAQTAADEVSNLATVPRGRLRVNAPMTFGTLHLGPVIADFLAAHDQIDMDLVMDDRFADLVEEGFDVGMEMSGSADAFRAMLKAMHHGGKVAILGIPPDDMSIDWTTVIFKGLILKGVYGREMFETWYKMSSMLQSGLTIDPIITHHFGIDEFQPAFELMESGQSGKIILHWDD